MIFELNLGPKRKVDNKLRHDEDAFWEILVDFPCGVEGASAGFLHTVRDIFSGKIRFWAVVDENGDYLPGCRGTYTTKRAALKAVDDFVHNCLFPEPKPVRKNQ